MTFARRRPLFVPDAATDERYWRRDLARDAGYNSLLCTPIIGHDSLLGTFTLYSSRPREFSAQIQDLMITIGGQLATAIERVHLFDALRESEEKFRDLFEKSEDAILIIENGKFVDCNQATVKMLCYNDKDDFLNAHPSALSPEKQPDGKISLEKANEMMDIAIEKGSHRFVWDHIRADGEVFPVEVLLTKITANETKQVLHAIWRDITDRVRAEMKLKEANKQLEAQLSENKKLQVALHEQAIRDPLTDLFNRRYLNEAIQHELARSARQGSSFSIAIPSQIMAKQAAVWQSEWN